MASSTIYLIRHGQASFQADEYDQLSPLGYQQASALGKWWGEHLPVPHLVAHGSLHRQRQSWESFREAASHNLPDAEILPGLNEHQGTEVMKYHAGKDAPKVDKKTALKTFFALNRRWLKGEIDSGPFENWADFQQRVRGTYEQLFSGLEGGEAIALFTSGGVIATGIGIALGLSDEKILELNWQIRNSSISILKHNKGRLFLRDFNWVPHLEEKAITYV